MSKNLLVLVLICMVGISSSSRGMNPQEISPEQLAKDLCSGRKKIIDVEAAAELVDTHFALAFSLEEKCKLPGIEAIPHITTALTAYTRILTLIDYGIASKEQYAMKESMLSKMKDLAKLLDIKFDQELTVRTTIALHSSAEMPPGINVFRIEIGNTPKTSITHEKQVKLTPPTADNYEGELGNLLKKLDLDCPQSEQ